MNYERIWQAVLGEIELSVPHSSFTTWFSSTELIDTEGGRAVVQVANIFIKAQLEKKFRAPILEMLKKSNVDVSSVVFQVKVTNGKRRAAVNRDIVEDTLPERNVDLFKPSKKSSTTNLNPRYTFDNFIVGSSNDLAYAASRAVADHPGQKYNPLFLYGGAGLGKTHLMQAIGNEIIRKQPKARVLYTTTEAFVNEFLEYIRFKKQGFSEKYRNVDVLIVDDMQFIAGKEKTQDEFFHTFNDLHQNDKQIIISSHKPP